MAVIGVSLRCFRSSSIPGTWQACASWPLCDEMEQHHQVWGVRSQLLTPLSRNFACSVWDTLSCLQEVAIMSVILVALLCLEDSEENVPPQALGWVRKQKIHFHFRCFIFGDFSDHRHDNLAWLYSLSIFWHTKMPSESIMHLIFLKLITVPGRRTMC